MGICRIHDSGESSRNYFSFVGDPGSSGSMVWVATHLKTVGEGKHYGRAALGGILGCRHHPPRMLQGISGRSASNQGAALALWNCRPRIRGLAPRNVALWGRIDGPKSEWSDHWSGAADSDPI